MRLRNLGLIAGFTAVFFGIGSVAIAAPAEKRNYVVQLVDGSTAADQLEARGAIVALGGTTSRAFHNVFKGYVANLTANAAAALAANPRVKVVVPDMPIHAADIQAPTPSWGLDRLDQTSLPLDSSFEYPTSPGSGVKIFVVDTGVQTNDPDFAGRTEAGVSFVTTDSGAANVDCNGHGTHVAGTAAGTEFGVAKSATIVPLRVLDCTGSGYFSWFSAAMDYVAGLNLNGVRAVATASLGADNYTDVTAITAVNNLVSKGVVVTLAAGNGNTNACNSSPAQAASAITVGATTSTDARASYSNFGTCLDIFAPGSSITSDYYLDPNATWTISGTSMATPHVAGAAATYLALNPAATPADVVAALQANAVAGAVTSPGTGSPNYLLNTRFMLSGGVTPVAPDSPTGLAVGTVASTSVGLSWVAPVNTGTSPLTGYRVEWKASANSVWSASTVTGTSTTVTGLASGVSYDFRVSAVSSAGTSAATASVSATTTVSGTVPTAPRSPLVRATYSNQVNLSWTAPSSNGGQTITGYKIQQSNAGIWSTVATVTTTSGSVTGLSASTSYSFRILATNVIGDSAPSTTLSATTLSGIPAKVGNPSVTVGSAGKVTVKWTAVPVVTFGTPITYRVEFLNSSSVVTNTFNVSTTSTSQVLARTTAYRVQVTAISGSVLGTPSNQVSFTTK